MDYCSLSILHHTSYHLLQHCIYYLAALWYQRKRQVIQTYMQVHRNNNPTKQSNDINQTWCRCNPLLFPSYQGQWKQEHIIHHQMIVSVMMMIVLEELRPVDSVRQHSCETFLKLTDSHQPKALCGKLNSSWSMHLSGTALKHCAVMQRSSRLSKRLWSRLPSRISSRLQSRLW